MITDKSSVKDIDDPHEVEKAIFTGNIAIFDIHFPKLVGPCDFSVLCDPTRMLNPQSFSGFKNIQLLTKAVYLLKVNYELLLPSKGQSQVAITISVFFSRNEL